MADCVQQENISLKLIIIDISQTLKYRTGSDGAGDTEPELEVESPTIGYRSELRE